LADAVDSETTHAAESVTVEVQHRQVRAARIPGMMDPHAARNAAVHKLLEIDAIAGMLDLARTTTWPDALTTAKTKQSSLMT
jgi:hypothetical protein